MSQHGSQTDSHAQSQRGPAPGDAEAAEGDVAQAAAQAIMHQTRDAAARVLEGITPWLVEMGDWIFAGLIAAWLVIVAALITIGPADRAITIATAAFALALPFDLAGLILLRLLRDTVRVDLAGKWEQAVRDAGFPVDEQPAAPAVRVAQQKRRTNIVLAYSLGICVLSVLLTLTGLVAALWHIAWWIGVLFIVMTLISLALVIGAFVTIGPPSTPEQKLRYQRYWDDMMRRAREQSTPHHEGT